MQRHEANFGFRDNRRNFVTCSVFASLTTREENMQENVGLLDVETNATWEDCGAQYYNLAYPFPNFFPHAACKNSFGDGVPQV